MEVNNMNIKFEDVLAILILCMLFIALLVFKNDKDIAKTIIGVMTAGFTGMVAYFFTKYNSNENK